MLFIAWNFTSITHNIHNGVLFLLWLCLLIVSGVISLQISSSILGTYRPGEKQQLELDMEQTGSKSGKEYIKAVYCHLAYLTYMQSTSWEMLG